MISRRYFISQLALLLAAGCGGSDNGPESERNSYGYSLSRLQNASSSITASTGTAMLKALGAESSASENNVPIWTVDPTGRVVYQAGTPNFYPVWYVAVMLTNADGDNVATERAVRTVWVVKEGEFISSRTLYTKDGKLFVVSFPNPPFSFEGTKAVVELTHGGASDLVSTPIAWNAK